MNQLNSNRYGCGSLDVGNGTRIDVHMANNAGRGNNNVTLTHVCDSVERPARSRQYNDADVIGQTHTSGWRGRWTLSRRVRDALGLCVDKDNG